MNEYTQMKRLIVDSPSESFATIYTAPEKPLSKTRRILSIYIRNVHESEAVTVGAYIETNAGTDSRCIIPPITLNAGEEFYVPRDGSLGSVNNPYAIMTGNISILKIENTAETGAFQVVVRYIDEDG